MSETNPPDPITNTEIPTSLTPSTPVPFAIEVIHNRLVGELNIRQLHNTSLTPEERTLRDVNEVSSSAVRSEEILNIANPEEEAIINATIINSRRIKGWMNSRGLTKYDDGEYHVETDPGQNIPGAKPPEDSRVVEMMIYTPDFDLNYSFFGNSTFDLRIDYTKRESGERPQYRSGRHSIHDGMTSEEAEIIGIYLKDFFETPRSIQKPAA